ncbi:hypothetical protein QUF55_08095, partial [Clostridiaceae bacterium HSG29]|nr:hypothetical protein [Clostridiaceae bacterium HSG29]
ILVVFNVFVNNSYNNAVIEFYNAVPIETYSDEYIISEKPMFTGDDIEYYGWNNQTIIFKKESGIDCKPIENFKSNYQTLSSFATTSRDKFYIYVEDEFIYDGYYAQSMISSFLPIGITMIDIENGVKIKYWALDNMDKNDERFNDRLYDALKANNILKE